MAAMMLGETVRESPQNHSLAGIVTTTWSSSISRDVKPRSEATAFATFPCSGKTTIFTRDAGTGRLEFVNVTTDGFTLAESPDGRDAYLSGNEFVFHLRAYSGCDELPATGCRTLGASGNAKLALKVGTLDGATDVMKWTWRRR